MTWLRSARRSTAVAGVEAARYCGEPVGDVVVDSGRGAALIQQRGSGRVDRAGDVIVAHGHRGEAGWRQLVAEVAAAGNRAAAAGRCRGWPEVPRAAAMPGQRVVAGLGETPELIRAPGRNGSGSERLRDQRAGSGANTGAGAAGVGSGSGVDSTSHGGVPNSAAAG